MFPGSPVIAYLHGPREKVWGVLVELNTSGLFVRGIDLNTFDDWVRMVAAGGKNIALSHIFIPMWRIERVILDETVDEIPSLAARFQASVGTSVEEYLGLKVPGVF